MMITASAPGSTMITGEHAVVHGHPAIVAAIAQRVRVTVAARADETAQIQTGVGAYDGPISRVPSTGPLRFLAACLKACPPDEGISLTVQSEIDPTMGFGSSAAVVIATLGALEKLTGRGIDIHAVALGIVRELQGRGSGADLAASLDGGIVRYQLGVAREALTVPPPCALCYVGYKTPTGEVLAQVEAAWTGRDVGALYARMGGASDKAIEAWRARDWSAVAEGLNRYQSLMEELGVSDDALSALIAAGQDTAPAAKISGSGLGDCVLAFGDVPPGWDPLAFDTEGLIVDG